LLRARRQQLAESRRTFTQRPGRRNSQPKRPRPKPRRWPVWVRVAYLARWVFHFEEPQLVNESPTPRVFLRWRLPEDQARTLADSLQVRLGESDETFTHGEQSLTWLACNLRFGIVRADTLPKAEQVCIETPTAQGFIRPEKLNLPIALRPTIAKYADALLASIREKLPAEKSVADCSGDSELAAELAVRRPDRRQAAPRRPGGRPSDTDHKADKRVFDAWKSGHYRTYADCARELNMSTEDVSLAVDRHEHRIRRKTR